ncbi:MAG: hypothetical protein ACI9FO_001429 [Methylophagaceae bacterium]|jgi:hypothetical protein
MNFQYQSCEKDETSGVLLTIRIEDSGLDCGCRHPVKNLAENNACYSYGDVLIRQRCHNYYSGIGN